MIYSPDRYDYLPLIDRPRLTWPNGARIAFWVAPNIEFYELAPPPVMGRPVWPRPFPDVLSYSTRDYGNRAGIWRIMDALDRYGVRASVSLNAAMCDHLPEVVEACVQRDWELFSHGIYNTRPISGLDDDQVRAIIADSVQTISRASGRPVKGWLAPAVSATEGFLDLLPEFGITYTIDMVPDDQPVPIHVRSGKLVAVPYSTDINDIRVIGVRGYAPDNWAEMVKSAFDQLYQEGADNCTVLSLPLHPYLIGQPHRIAALEDILKHVTGHEDVWLATAGEISDWYIEHHYDNVSAFLAQARTMEKSRG